jgi:hypothetical protein
MAIQRHFIPEFTKLMRLRPAFPTQDRVSLARQLVIVNKFQFAAKLLAQIVNRLYVCPTVRIVTREKALAYVR